jgi:hypothetical protein
VIGPLGMGYTAFAACEDVAGVEELQAKTRGKK